MEHLNLETLTQYYKTHRDTFDEEFRLRIHRAISWLTKAVNTENDDDIKFITLWISFNAAYAKELSDGRNFDKQTFQKFIKLITKADTEGQLQKVMWETLPEQLARLLDNQYTFAAFWKFHNGIYSEQQWLDERKKITEAKCRAIKNKNTSKLMMFTFEHLYILRNQIIHGSSTYNSNVNREQLKDACCILETLIPVIAEIMMKNHNTQDWGKPFYPVVK